MIIAGLMGAMLGSFAVAQVWRLRAYQLVEDKKAGEPVSAAELRRLSPLTTTNIRQDRSRCLSCQHQLAWYDLVPVVSWLSLGGRCRYCRQPIGWAEVAGEVALAGLFAVSAWLWPLATWLDIASLVVWLCGLVCLTVLFIYDAKWFLLPDSLNYAFIGLGLAYALFQIGGSSAMWTGVLDLAGALVILPGLYLALYLMSSGRWVGFGDVKLAVGLALFLGNWQLAFLALFAANLIGTIIVLPGMISGSLKKGAKVPFGPLLIVGFVLIFFVGQTIVDWYQAMLFF